ISPASILLHQLVRFSVSCRRFSIILFDLRHAGFDLAITLVVHNNDAVWRDLALGHLEGCRDSAVGKQTFSGAKRDRKYHELQLINKIIFKERLQQICASEYVQIRSVLLLKLPYFFRDIAV